MAEKVVLNFVSSGTIYIIKAEMTPGRQKLPNFHNSAIHVTFYKTANSWQWTNWNNSTWLSVHYV